MAKGTTAILSGLMFGCFCKHLPFIHLMVHKNIIIENIIEKFVANHKAFYVPNDLFKTRYLLNTFIKHKESNIF